MYNKIFKRLFDLIISLVLLPIVIFIVSIFGIIIYLEDKGPIFYNAERLGREGLPFKMYKLRTMKVNSPDIRLEDGSTFNSIDDPRVTKIGKFLRKTSLDEVPQILNVIIGNMSIVGPRPDTIDSLAAYHKGFDLILQARPGITGYNQAYFRNSISSLEKMENDLTYATKISLTFDFKILIKTVQTVLARENVYSND